MDQGEARKGIWTNGKIGIGKWTNQKAVLPISAGVQLVCMLASHLTGALGVALLSPHNFSPGELLGGFAVPEHGAIHVWHLGGAGGAVKDLKASADEAAVLEPGVHGHGVVHAEVVTEVGGVGHPPGPGQRLAVQLEVHRLLNPGLFADH